MNKDVASLIAKEIHDPWTWNSFSRINKNTYFVSKQMEQEKKTEFYPIIMENLCNNLGNKKIINERKNILNEIGEKFYYHRKPPFEDDPSDKINKQQINKQQQNIREYYEAELKNVYWQGNDYYFSCLVTLNNMLPSNTTDTYWLHAWREVGSYPKHTDKSGKWLIFVPMTTIDTHWKRISLAVRDGQMGSVAKVSTRKPNPHSINSKNGVIIVYTYNHEDSIDVNRIRTTLRDLGYTQRLVYKTDQATKNKEYSKNSKGPVGTYYY